MIKLFIMKVEVMVIPSMQEQYKVDEIVDFLRIRIELIVILYLAIR